MDRFNSAPLLQKLGLLMTVVSFFILYPGVTEPVMTLSAELNVFGVKTKILEETRSIWETVVTLHELGYTPVAVMVVTFSMVIPIGKGLVILFTWFNPTPMRWCLISAISKWSMADVFVVAILVAFFTARSTAELDSQILVGFYWFFGYCVLSIISGQLLLAGSEQAAKQASEKQTSQHS